jgi:dihydroorotase
MTTQLVIDRPDDWHVHFRDAEVLGDVVGATARQFGRALVMPNLKPPVVTAEMAVAYRSRILASLPQGLTFEPWMTLYLTDHTSPETVRAAKDSGVVLAFKLYPAGATTNSDSGVTDLRHCQAALAEMERLGMVLCLHGEVTGQHDDVFDREALFIDRILEPMRRDFPGLRLVFEHITTAEAADYVRQTSGDIAATITPQHLLLNRNDMLVGGIRPHLYCLPVLKRNSHQQALIRAACSGSPKFFLGTDSAPHSTARKESACGCAGCYTAHAAIELYAEVFDNEGALPLLEGFASHFGPDFYRLPRNTDSITLHKASWQVPANQAMGDTVLTPLRAGEAVHWRVLDRDTAV